MQLNDRSDNDLHFIIPSGKRLALLLLTFIFGYAIASILNVLLMNVTGVTTASLRIGTVIQDVVMLMLPAVATAMLSTRRPATFLRLERRPKGIFLFVAMAVMIVSAPLMSLIVKLNESVTLPESMASIEQALRTMENNAGASINLMLGAHNIPNLIVSILLVGILAGVCEELFFRGALQGLLSTSKRMSSGTAIWIAAAIFSLVHFQFFGFFPRMLLGAYFGFLLVWSGSIWVPMCVHAFNNVMYVLIQYGNGSGEITSAWYCSTGTIAISTVLTIFGITYLYTNRLTISSPNNTEATDEQ